jgi:isoleucyl-tRNA synthetase
MISKKRFWGLALPIWVCDSCGHFDVIGGREELRRRAVAGWEKFEGHSPHRPWVDLVKVRCEKCGGEASRIPDVGNPWLDAGIVPFSTVGYNRDRQYWEEWFPADFITESFPGQFRNWFYAILAMSTMMEHRAPFKVLLGHGLVRDQKGEEMHKSKGNAIPFDGAVDTGYRLFHERDPKQNLKAQAHRDLPEGWVEGSVKEETLTLDNKPRLVVSAGYPPMGADEMRWLYCRHNPALNINFGPEPAEELRSRFLLKLWNTYAFFVNNARQAKGGFDLGAPPVPVHERPDIDRWILSDLQKLVRTARKAFDEYNVMAFCLEAERFVDDKLSNWYVRRNRRRFWKGEEGRDKQAAYQTLYTVLLTLTKLAAPAMPFLTEMMYQNLKAAGDPESVHLCDYPQVKDSLIDDELSQHLDDLLRLVSLGLAARNAAGHKVRQPLAELRVEPRTLAELEAVVRFEDQLRDELNVKRVRLHLSAEKLELLKAAKEKYRLGSEVLTHVDENPMLRQTVRLNPKTAKAKYKGKSEAAAAALATMNGTTVADKMGSAGRFTLLGVELGPEDLLFGWAGPDGWAGLADQKRGTQVMIDTRITPELAREGKAREVVRHTQQARKDAGLEMEDRIVLYLHTESAELRQAIDAHRDYIAAETLTVRWSAGSLNGQGHGTDVKVDGQPLRIELNKAPTEA